MRVAEFDFILPEEQIALRPLAQKERARLLAIPASGGFSDYTIADIPALLSPRDLLVFNDTKVIPARLIGRRGESKGTLTLHKQKELLTWEVFAKPAKRLRVGDEVRFAEDFSAVVKAKGENGVVTLCFNEKDVALFYAKLARYGHMPLPPYIAKHRAEDEQDDEDYQTIFAQKEGAVAAPTAGLHFTESLVNACTAKGVNIAQVTLHVGGGTFLPVKAEDTKDHVMHAEYAELSEETARRVNEAKAAGGKVIAVGTTSLRVLESATTPEGITQAYQGETNIFITPGYRFRVVDRLLTNFHLPRSTLFMLVSALAGTERMKEAYTHAVAEGYRFYSYGDACLIDYGATP
jgi:S-adenosylmethionine:tRNA ribosyltransferase-isomerase